MATKEMKTLKLPSSQDTYKVVDSEAVHFTSQTLTDEQKAQVKTNLGISESGGTSDVITLTSGDLDDYTTPGTKLFIPAESSANIANKYWSSNVNLYIEVISLSPDDSFILQYGIMLDNRRIQIRYYIPSSNTWSAWTYFLNSAVLVGINNGGTGAGTAEAARTNLGITPANIGAAATAHTHSNYLETSKIIYSSTEPTGVAGAIWFKPV